MSHAFPGISYRGAVWRDICLTYREAPHCFEACASRATVAYWVGRITGQRYRPSHIRAILEAARDQRAARRLTQGTDRLPYATCTRFRVVDPDGFDDYIPACGHAVSKRDRAKADRREAHVASVRDGAEMRAHRETLHAAGVSEIIVVSLVEPYESPVEMAHFTSRSVCRGWLRKHVGSFRPMRRWCTREMKVVALPTNPPGVTTEWFSAAKPFVDITAEMTEGLPL